MLPSVPFLPLRPDFHPKRNQARQKLATLPKNRFKDLASDVYFELNRRYPEFSEPEQPDEVSTSFDASVYLLSSDLIYPLVLPAPAALQPTSPLRTRRTRDAVRVRCHLL